jgi:hypothetical protein
MKLRQLLFGLAISLLGLPMSAAGVDGVVEINQAKALAGGVTASDTPGFPVTLDTSGSYRLTSDLDVGALGLGVEITTDHVTLDLNGFSIFCTPPIGADPDLPCPDPGVGLPIGINASGRLNVAIENGSVRGIGGYGIQAGNHCRVRNMRVFRNLFDGMEVGNDCTVESVDASENGDTGMEMGGASSVTDAVASDNGGTGIVVGTGSTVHHSTARGNPVGFSTSWGTTFRGCAASANQVGIFSTQAVTVTGSSADSNTTTGIEVGTGSSITHSSVRSNQVGIVAGAGSTLIGNTARDNAGLGFDMLGADVGYAQNVLVGNNGAAAELSGGTSLGTNFCDTNTTCP